MILTKETLPRFMVVSPLLKKLYLMLSFTVAIQYTFVILSLDGKNR